jgi:hypothetical protein
MQIRMKAISAIIVLVILVGSCTDKKSVATQNADMLDIVIQLNQTESYCGGARPTEEMLTELSQPKPLAGERLYVRKGSENNIDEPVVASEITDKTGKAIFHLAPGKYCIVRAPKSDNLQTEKWKKELLKGNEFYAPIDIECLKKWLATPELVIEVGENGPLKFELLINKPCTWNSIPCAQYIGPLPG